MDHNFPGHNASAYMQEHYHPQNPHSVLPPHIVGQHPTMAQWAQHSMHQQELMMPSEDHKGFMSIPSVINDYGNIAAAKDNDKRTSKRTRMDPRDEHPSEGSSISDATGTAPGNSHSSSAAPISWELAAVLGPEAASLSSNRRNSASAFDHGRSDMDKVTGSKESSDSQGDSDEDDGEGEGRRDKKQQMNRKAAQLSRRRKKERIQELEASVINLSRRNHELKVMNELLRDLLSQRAKQQARNEEHIMRLLSTKNMQLKQALNDLRSHEGMTELPTSSVFRSAALLGPDFQFQQLGMIPSLGAPGPSQQSPYMMSQQYNPNPMFSPMDMQEPLASSYPHGMSNQGRGVPGMMLPQMRGNMDPSLGSLGIGLRAPPPVGQGPMRHDMEAYGDMPRLPSDTQDLPGIVQSSKAM